MNTCIGWETSFERLAEMLAIGRVPSSDAGRGRRVEVSLPERKSRFGILDRRWSCRVHPNLILRGLMPTMNKAEVFVVK